MNGIAFNPVRLLEMDEAEQAAMLRRSVTEAIARMLRETDTHRKGPLKVFLSHAKQDGVSIAAPIRDAIRQFSQLEAWFDANDLPYGTPWESPMEEAVREGTAAMIATVTDAYPTRPWCRREAMLARRPVSASKDDDCCVWKVQPTVAVHRPGSSWVRGMSMLEGVARIGWTEEAPVEQTRRIVDRLVLEVLLSLTHCRLATQLADSCPAKKRSQRCYLTWVPDGWTLVQLRNEMGSRASSVRQLIYPGYGLTVAETKELEPVVQTFHKKTRLVSFEEVWS